MSNYYYTSLGEDEQIEQLKKQSNFTYKVTYNTAVNTDLQGHANQYADYVSLDKVWSGKGYTYYTPAKKKKKIG